METVSSVQADAIPRVSKLLTKPKLPQADVNGVINDWHWSLDENDDIIVTVDQLEGSDNNGATITVYFDENNSKQWIVDPNTNPPAGLPYTFYFKAGSLPDGPYKVYYTVDEVSGDCNSSDPTSVIIVNSPDRQGVVVDHIDANIHPNNADPGGTDTIQATVYGENQEILPNAWVVFHGPNDAKIDPLVTQTNSRGEARCNVTYPDTGTITVDILCGRVLQLTNPAFGNASSYSLGLVPAKGDTITYGDGTQTHKATALFEHKSQLVKNPDGQVLVNFTLPSDKSARFVNGPDVQAYEPTSIWVKTQGGIAHASFTDSNEAGETVFLNAKLADDLAPPAPSLPFTFKQVWDLKLTKLTDNEPPKGHAADVGQASVTRDGKLLSNGDSTLVKFTLDKTTAIFLDKDPNIVERHPQEIIVKTSNGVAKAWFFDNNPDGEKVTLTASLLEHTNVKQKTQVFTFKPANQSIPSGTIYLQADNKAYITLDTVESLGTGATWVDCWTYNADQPWNRFIVVPCGGNQLALQAYDGTYLTIIPGYDGIDSNPNINLLVAQDSAPGPNSTFVAHYIDKANNIITLQWQNKYFHRAPTADLDVIGADKEQLHPYCYFKATNAPKDYEIILNSLTPDGVPPGSENEGRAIVTDKGQPLKEGDYRVIKFTLSGSSTARFDQSNPYILRSEYQAIYVKVHKNAQGQDIADASFSDSAVETISLNAALLDYPVIKAKPQKFKFL